jgi:transposase
LNLNLSPNWTPGNDSSITIATWRQFYTDDFKTQAIALAESGWSGQGGPAVGHTGQDTVSLAGGRASQPLTSPGRKPVSEMESESIRLLIENATIGMAREILKKATAFFAGTSK